MQLLHSYRTMCTVLKIIHSTLSWNKYIGKEFKKQKQKILATMTGLPATLSQQLSTALIMVFFPPLSSHVSQFPTWSTRARHGFGAMKAHSLLTLVLQECRTALKRRGSCSRGTFTIFPVKKEPELAAIPEPDLKNAHLQQAGDIGDSFTLNL